MINEIKKNSKKIVFVTIFIIAITSLLGGAIGEIFGLGFASFPFPLISVAPETLFSIGNYNFSNTTLTLIISGIIVVTLGFFATRKMKEVPSGLQNFFEVVFDLFASLGKSFGGKKITKLIPIVVIFFLVIVTANYVGLLPIAGSVGRIESFEEWFHHNRDERVELVQNNSSIIKSGLNAKELEELVTVRILLNSDQRFVAFDDSGIIPFGRGEQQKVSISNIVNLDIGTLNSIENRLLKGEALSNGEQDYLHKVEEQIHNGVVVQKFESAQGKTVDLEGKKVGLLIPFFRAATTDITFTLSLALLAVLIIQITGIASLGFKGYGAKFISFKRGFMHLLVGPLEFIGELAKIISFTFRLFGNIFAGEILLVSMSFLLPFLGALPFMALEFFVGVLQAFVFALLMIVFSSLAAEDHSKSGQHEQNEHNQEREKLPSSV